MRPIMYFIIALTFMISAMFSAYKWVTYKHKRLADVFQCVIAILLGSAYIVYTIEVVYTQVATSAWKIEIENILDILLWVAIALSIVVQLAAEIKRKRKEEGHE